MKLISTAAKLSIPSVDLQNYTFCLAAKCELQNEYKNHENCIGHGLNELQ